MIRIWDLPTRLFHWILVLLVSFSIVSAKIGGNWIDWHMRSGYCILTLVLFRAYKGQFSSRHHVAVAAVTLYWHFVDVVWIFLFGILYLGVTAFR